jgi:DNA-binding transcriptional ArsR family regulator
MSQLAPFRLPEAPARQDLVAKYFRALGDPTRLRILALLGAEGELSAGELTRRLGLASPRSPTTLPAARWWPEGRAAPGSWGKPLRHVRVGGASPAALL